MKQKPKEKDTVRAIRFPLDLWAFLLKESEKNGRTARGELIHRLRQTV